MNVSTLMAGLPNLAHFEWLVSHLQVGRCETGTSALTTEQHAETIRLATNNAVLSLLHHRLQESGGEAGLGEKLTPLVRPATLRRLRLRAELARIASLFNQHNIKLIALKGPMLAECLYQHPRLRDFGDLDLLVPASAREPALRLMNQLGYYSPYQNKDLHERYHIVFCHRDTSECIELHWRIAGYEFPEYKSGEFLWTGAAEQPILDARILMPTAEATFLYLCIHAYKHDWSRLQWLRDLSEVLASSPRFDWSYLWSMAQRYHALGVVQASLQLLELLFPVPDLSGSGVQRSPLDESQLRLVLSGMLQQDETSQKLQRTIKLRMYLMDTLADRIRLLRAKIRPSDRDREFSGGGRLPRLWYWLVRPYRIARILLAQRRRV